jgi:hypothetical protein
MGLKAGWLALCLFVWIIGAFLGSTFEYHVDETTGTAEQIAAAGAQAGHWAGSEDGGYAQSPITTLDYISDISNVFSKTDVLFLSIPAPNSQYFKAVLNVVTWRWSFMEEADMFYWIFLFPFVAMGIFSLLMIGYGVLTGNLTF